MQSGYLDLQDENDSVRVIWGVVYHVQPARLVWDSWKLSVSDQREPTHQFSLLAFILSAAFDPTTKATDMNGWKLLNWISIKQNSKVSRVNAGNMACVWSCSYSFPYVSQTLGPLWFGSTGRSGSNWLGTADGAELATASGETWREKRHAVFAFCSGENGGKIMGTWWTLDWKKLSMEIVNTPWPDWSTTLGSSQVISAGLFEATMAF